MWYRDIGDSLEIIYYRKFIKGRNIRNNEDIRDVKKKNR